MDRTEYNREWRKKNRDRLRAYARAYWKGWYLRNRKKELARIEAWRQRNKEKVLARQRAYARAYRAKLIQQLGQQRFNEMRREWRRANLDRCLRTEREYYATVLRDDESYQAKNRARATDWYRDKQLRAVPEHFREIRTAMMDWLSSKQGRHTRSRHE